MATEPRPPLETLPAASARAALSAFFVTGLLLSFLGPIIPAWGYHREFRFDILGHYFLSMNAGVLAAGFAAPRWLISRGTKTGVVAGCAISGAALLFLALFSPPASAWWRVLGLFWLGAGAGLLSSSAFHAITSAYRHNPAATVNLANILFGLGCLTTSLLVAGTFYVYTVPSIVFLLAMVPLLLTARFGRARLESPPPVLHPPVGQVLADFRNPAAVLLSLLLFFQFGNEWAIAGWLPIFLIQRIGTSPATAIWMLSLFWTALLAGRVLAQPVLPRLDHRKFLLMSVLSAMFGCLMLRFTNNALGAGVGVLLAGIGFAAIYPLVVEMIGARFPYYHPGIFNGIFSIAVTGGFLAPATLGYFASQLGVSVVMWLPMAGAFLVFFIVLLIWLEARLSGAR